MNLMRIANYIKVLIWDLIDELINESMPFKVQTLQSRGKTEVY